MKKAVILLFASLCMLQIALCENIRIDNLVFTAAKEATQFIASGNYTKGAACINNMDSESLRQSFEKKVNQPSFASIQSDVSVAWQSGNEVFIAVPIELPHDNMIKTIVFKMCNGNTISYVDVYNWRDVEIMYKQSSEIIWNTEYNPGYIVVID